MSLESLGATAWRGVPVRPHDDASGTWHRPAIMMAIALVIIGCAGVLSPSILETYGPLVVNRVLGNLAAHGYLRAPAPQSESGPPAREANATAERETAVRDIQRADILARELASARQEAASANARGTVEAAEPHELSQELQSTQNAAAELRRALNEERNRAEALARDLAAAQEEVASIPARFADESAQRLKSLQVMHSANATAAEHRQAYEQERDKAEALARELNAARAQLERLSDNLALAEAETEKHKQALDAERERVAALARDLSAAGEETKILENPLLLVGAPKLVKTTSVFSHSAPH